jgi:hypothetical protein
VGHRKLKMFSWKNAFATSDFVSTEKGKVGQYENEFLEK